MINNDWYILTLQIKASGKDRRDLMGLSQDIDKLKNHAENWARKHKHNIETASWQDEGSKETLHFGEIYLGIFTFTIEHIPDEMILK